VAAGLVPLLVITPFGYFAFLRSQQKSIGVDFARVGEVYDPEKMPRDWTLLKVSKLKTRAKELRLVHYERPVFMIPEEHGVMVDSKGLITEIIEGDDALHRRFEKLETQRVLKR
jgi:hypothetical protein